VQLSSIKVLPDPKKNGKEGKETGKKTGDENLWCGVLIRWNPPKNWWGKRAIFYPNTQTAGLSLKVLRVRNTDEKGIKKNAGSFKERKRVKSSD